MDLKGRFDTEARSSIWYTVSNLLSKTISFAFIPIFMSVMSTEEIGEYSLYVSWLGIISVVASLQMHGSISYRALMKYSDNDNFILTAIAAGATPSVIILTLYILFRKSVDAITGLSFGISIIMLIQILLNTTEGFVLAIARFRAKYRWVSLINLLTGTLTPILSLLLIMNGLRGSYARIIAPFIISILFLLFHLISHTPHHRIGFCFGEYSFLLKEGGCMFWHFILLSLIANADRIIISHTLGTDMLGAYSVGHTAAYMTVPLTSGISSALIPWLTKNSAAYKIDILRRRFSEMLFLSSFIILLFFLVLPEGFGFIASGKPDDGLLSAYLLTISFLLSFLSSLISTVTLCHTRVSVILCSLVSFLTGAVFIIPLTRIYGITGGAIFSLISNLTLMLTGLYLLRTRLGKSVISAKGLLYFFVSISVGGFLLWQIRGNLLLRMLLALLALIIILMLASRNRRTRDTLLEGRG